MATVDEVVRDALAAINTDAGAVAGAKWLDNRYKELVSRVKFRHLRQVGELSLPAKITTGTVSATRGSTSVTGVATTFETEVGSGTQDDYFFQTNSAWYRIDSITDETNLVLDSAFAEDDVSTGSYKIVKRYHSLASNARWMGDFYHTRLRQLLGSVSLAELDIIAPGRALAGNIPYRVAQVGVDSDGVPQVEIYPPPNESELINYIYWSLPTALLLASTIPPVIDAHVLKEGVLIDLYRYEKASELRKGNVEAAGVWRNEEKTQITYWNRFIKDAIRTSRGADDISLILEMWHGAPSRRFDQRTAHEYVYDNWSR